MTAATRRCPHERHLVAWATNTAVTRPSRRERRGHVSLRAAGMRSPKASTAWTPPAAMQIPRDVIKGGAFLCVDSHCLSHRPAARP